MKKNGILFCVVGGGIVFLFPIACIFYSLLYQLIYHKCTIPLWNSELEQLIPKDKISIQSGSHSNLGGYHAEFNIRIPNMEDQKSFLYNVHKIGEQYTLTVDNESKNPHYVLYKEGYGIHIEKKENGFFYVEFDDFDCAQFDYIRMSKYSR